MTDPIKTAREALERIRDTSDVSGQCTCGRPNGIPAIKFRAETTLAALDQMQAGDVEALNREVLKAYGGNGIVERSRLEDMEWVIDHLHATGRLCAKLPKIDGLDDALEYYGPDNAGEMRLFDTTGEDFTRQFKALIAAARAYRERME